LWMEWMEQNPHQAHALFEQGNPHVVRLLSHLVLTGKRSGIISPPYINWNEETTPEGVQTPAGWPEGHNKSSTSSQPEDSKSPPKSPSSPPAINLGESSSSSSSEFFSDRELPSQTLESLPLQHQNTPQTIPPAPVPPPPSHTGLSTILLLSNPSLILPFFFFFLFNSYSYSAYMAMTVN